MAMPCDAVYSAGILALDAGDGNLQRSHVSDLRQHVLYAEFQPLQHHVL